jgi:anaerobic ribonucleoside-triphosphate reductase
MNNLKFEVNGISHTVSESERTTCEVWTRVMGYHRPTDNFNKGKQAEHAERKFYKESIALGRLTN